MDRIFKDPGFRIHFIVYVAVNLLLFVINMMSSDKGFWFQWPLIGWGIGILGHAYLVSNAPGSKRS